MHQGKASTADSHFDALSAFWPALQVLVGDLELAASTHAAFHSLWRLHGVLPERYDLRKNSLLPAAWADMYPLRPELAESCYALYRATGHPRCLHASGPRWREARAPIPSVATPFERERAPTVWALGAKVPAHGRRDGALAQQVRADGRRLRLHLVGPTAQAGATQCVGEPCVRLPLNADF